MVTNDQRFHANRDGSVELADDPTPEMARIAKSGNDLLDEVMAAFAECGWTEVSRDRVGSQPKWLTIQRGDEERRLAIYVWTLVFGGREEYPWERRIQVGKSTRGRLQTGDDFETLLLGYYERNGAKVMAACDVSRHLKPKAQESCQVSIESIARAMRDGFDHYQGKTGEFIAVFRPELIDVYCKYRGALHQGGLLQSQLQPDDVEAEFLEEDEPTSYLLAVHQSSLDEEAGTLTLNAEEHGDIGVGDSIWLVVATEHGMHLWERARVGAREEQEDTVVLTLEARETMETKVPVQSLVPLPELPESIRAGLQALLEE